MGQGPCQPIESEILERAAEQTKDYPKIGDRYEFKASRRIAKVAAIFDMGRIICLRFSDGQEAQVPLTDLWQAAGRK